MNKHPGQLAICEDEFRDQIDRIVSIAAELFRRRLIRPKLSVELVMMMHICELKCMYNGWDNKTDLSKIQTGTIPTIVVVPVHMEDLLSLYR